MGAGSGKSARFVRLRIGDSARPRIALWEGRLAHLMISAFTTFTPAGNSADFKNSLKASLDSFSFARVLELMSALLGREDNCLSFRRRSIGASWCLGHPLLKL